jgi:hypothetical protein
MISMAGMGGISGSCCATVRADTPGILRHPPACTLG